MCWTRERLELGVRWWRTGKFKLKSMKGSRSNTGVGRVSESLAVLAGCGSCFHEHFGIMVGLLRTWRLTEHDAWRR